MAKAQIPPATEAGKQLIDAMAEALRAHGKAADPHLTHLFNRLYLFVTAIERELSELKAHIPVQTLKRG